jgi:nifR3 family TIM-barrel protein
MENFYDATQRPILTLAPMAGYTNQPFRRICKHFGADVVCSEMASAIALSYGGKKTLEMLRFSEDERPYVVQLFGADPRHFRSAARIVTERIRPDGIDLNMGCPAPKVYKTGAGAALFCNQDKALSIIEETLAGTDLPVSIKIRARVGEHTAYKFMKKVKDYPLAAVMVHGRSYEKGFVGEIDYRTIKRIKEMVPFPVLANGGVNTVFDAKRVLEKTGADGLGIARGALRNPWLFSQIKEFLATGKCREFTLSEIKEAALTHARMAEEDLGAHGILEMRKYLLWYFRGFENAKEFRRKLVEVETYADVEKTLAMLEDGMEE